MRRFFLLFLASLFLAIGPVYAANDFSGDANCVALYTFENDWPTSGVLDDEKGNNDCDQHNTVTRDGVNQQEGSYCADFEFSNTEYFDCADGDLDSGFPGKSGESNPDFSICFWINLESLIATDRNIVSKYDYGAGKRTWRIRAEADDSAIVVGIGYNGGASAVDADHLAAISTGQWYHVGVVYDDDGGADSKGNVKIRIWDKNAGAILQSGGNDTHDEDIGQQMNIEDAPFGIGAIFSNGAAPGSEMDGILDELVIFNDLLSNAEIDQIRGGTYGAGAGLSIPVGMQHYMQRRRN